MSKPWKPPQHTAKLRPSRIRRDPLLVPAPVAADKKSQWESLEWERRFAIGGILLFAIAITVVTVAISAVTAGYSFGAPPVDTQKFGACEGGPNCVVDGETIRMSGETIKIAGMTTPRTEGARCREQEQRAVDAIQRLTTLLNSGKVTTAGEVREPDGELRTRVLVNGRDVAPAMIATGVARVNDGENQVWC